METEVKTESHVAEFVVVAIGTYVVVKGLKKVASWRRELKQSRKDIAELKKQQKRIEKQMKEHGYEVVKTK